MEETLDQRDVLGSELDSVSPQTENIQANVGQDTLNADRKKDVLSIAKLQEQLHLDQQQVSVRKATESDVDIDYFWSLDLFTANAAQEQKRVFEEKLHLQAQAYKAQALEQENVKLSAELNHTQSMCECLQWKIRKLELEMTNNSPENNMVTSLQEDLQRKREHLTAVNEKVSDLMYKLDCKESQLVAEREKASEEISVLKAQVNEAREHKKEFQKSPILLSSMEMEICPVREMNLNLETQNTLLEQGNLELSAKPHQVEVKSYITETSSQNLQMKITDLDLKLADSSKIQNRLITSLLEDLKTQRERCIGVNNKVLGLMNESSCKKSQLMVELEKASQKFVSPLSSVEVELHQVKEMNLDLKRQNTLLEKKNVELSTELNQVRTNKNSNEERFTNFVHECDCVQKKIREHADKSTNCHISRRHKHVLKTENEQLIAIHKKVSKMIHVLDYKENQLVAEREKASGKISVLKAQVNEAREHKKQFQILLESMEMELCHMKEMNLNLKTQNTVLEQGNLELSAKLKQLEPKPYVTETSALIHKFDCKENQIMVEQEKASQEKLVLQVQVHEAQASAMELRLQQQNIRLTDKERECRKIEEDLRNTQKANEMLKEELYSIFMECDRMKKKYNENQLKFKHILYQAKRKFNKKTEGLDSTIQKLEKEVKRLTSLLTEEKKRFSEYRMKHKHK
ncbi:hypothetical protein D4764_08G0010950 [Takifugu flavidus]|uniref:Uncharacterized protein n=1 Tax=Takifugu flavidus TaxID=433684 RepID=A0A5C6MRW6_9TELE|nr:hypothetical protein D4764_08G0010950 [Takifugu flavidus]